MLNFKIILVYVIISPPAPPEGLRVRPPRYLPVLILDFHGAPFGGTCAGDDGEHEGHRPNDEHAVGDNQDFYGRLVYHLHPEISNI